MASSGMGGTFTDDESAVYGAWASYTPTWTGSGSNPAIVNGTIVGAFIQIGKTVKLRIRITAGSSTTFGTGNYSFGLPTTANESSLNFTPMGTWGAHGGANNYVGFAVLDTTTSMQCLTISVVTASLAAGIMTNTAPATWASGDVIMIKASYEST